jgi:hypothetical protein
MPLSRLIRFTAMLLIPALLTNSMAFAAKAPADPAAMKARVQARGVGNGVRVTLADNTEVKGLIVSIGEQSFAVNPRHAGQPREIEYAQLTGVHKDKMGAGAKVIIIVAIAGVAIGVTAIVIDHKVNNIFNTPLCPNNNCS